MRNLKFLAMALLLVAALAIGTACSSDDPVEVVAPQTTPTPAPPADEVAATPEPATPEPVAAFTYRFDEFIQGNWWSNWDTATNVPTNPMDEDRLWDRVELEQEFGFTGRAINVGGWDTARDMIPMEIMGGSRDFQLWHIDNGWFAGLNRQGMFAPLDMDWFITDYGTNWHLGTAEASMINGVPFAFNQGPINGGGVYFNQRLFEEAGLDPELPFELQLRGEWTWDTFRELSQQLTRDLTGDGTPDVFGLATFPQDFLGRALASNGTNPVGFDPATQRFTNVTNTPEFIEAFNWMQQVFDDGSVMTQPEGGEWNWFISAFNNGQAAMRAGGDYIAGGQINPNLDDPWGFVSFPMGPRADTYMFRGNHNFIAVPNTFNREEAQEIVHMFALWYRALPGWDPQTAWVAGAHANHYNPRSVNETMMLFARNSEHMSPCFRGMAGIPDGPNGFGETFAWSMWQEGTDVAAVIEAGQLVWNDMLARANGDID